MTPRERMAAILLECADDHMIAPELIRGRSVQSEAVAARYDYVRRVHSAIGTSRSHTSRVTGFDRKTVGKALAHEV